MKESFSKNLTILGIVLSIILLALLIVDNKKKEENLILVKSAVITTIKDTRESSYETGCNNGSYQSCLLLEDIKDRYTQCLQAALQNCKTWAMQYRDETLQQKKDKKSESKTINNKNKDKS
jgi:hypothetical protein